MIDYNQKTLNKLLKIVGIAQNHMEVNALRKEVLPAIQKLFNSSSCTFFLTGDNGTLIDPVTTGIDKSYLKLYKAHYHRQNPFDPTNFNPFSSIQQGDLVVTDRSLFTMSKFVKTEYYNDFLKPQKIHNQMVIFLKSRGKLLGFLGIHRSKKGDSFEGAESKIGNILGPHISSALKNTQSYALMKEKQDFYHAISECRSTGFLILNKELSVVYSNTRGFEILKNNFSINCKALPFFLPSILFNAANEFIKNRKSKQVIENIAIDRYLINFQTFDRQFDKSGENRFLLSIEEIPSINVIDNNRLKEEYALSAREIEIISYVHKGFKNAEIAKSIFITEGTVKNHLKNIFRKVGVENRTSLIHESISIY